jgi:molybdenum cofactor synthesis domain-containing protein
VSQRSALVITASTRAAAGIYPDTAGPELVEGLRRLGFVVDGPRVVSGGEPVDRALGDAVRSGYDLVLTTGGTGLSPQDVTPDLTRGILDREVPGVGEAVRAAGLAAGVDTAMLSCGIAGVAGNTFIVNLPGSPRGARDGLAVVAPVLRHVVDQIAGGDH